MGQLERAKEDKGSNKRAKAKQARGRRGGTTGGADWKQFDWAATIALVEVLAEQDGALRIGRTRDGGAWALGVYLGDDYATEYIRPSEDFQDAILEICEAWLSYESCSAWAHRLLELRETVGMK